MKHNFIQTNTVTLHVVSDGPISGQQVILLHGFPEFSYGWRFQLSVLAEKGYHVWAPDQRGYNLSDKPDEISAYSLNELAADVIGLIDAAGREKAFIVGHDWGAAVAWWVALNYPERVERMVVMNVPHPMVMREQLRNNFAQLLKSWYILFFQLPWLPEAIAPLNNWSMTINALKKSSRPGTFTEKDWEIYREAWSQPNAYSSMLNWYRSIIQKTPHIPENPRITIPTLLIWGVHDMFLGRELAQPSIDLCDNGTLVFFEEATHWVHHEKANQVNTLIDNFFLECQFRIS